MSEPTPEPTPKLSDVRRALEVAAQVPTESIDMRLDELEARLMSAIDDDSDRRGAVIMPIEAARRTRRSRRVLGAVASAACILGIVVVSLAWFGDADSDVVISSADGVSVVLPDGSVVAGAEGLELPDGSLLDVDGSLVVDGQAFGPGDYIVGPDGIVSAPNTPGPGLVDSTTTTAPTTTTAVSAGDGAPVSTAVPENTVDEPSDPAVTTRPPAPSSTRPPVTRPPATSPPPTRPPASTVPTRPTTAVSRPTTTLSRPTTTTIATTVPARGEPSDGDAGARTRGD